MATDMHAPPLLLVVRLMDSQRIKRGKKESRSPTLVEGKAEVPAGGRPCLEGRDLIGFQGLHGHAYIFPVSFHLFYKGGIVTEEAEKSQGLSLPDLT